MADRKQIVFCADGIFPHAIGGIQRHSALLIPELARSNAFDIIVVHGHDKNVFNGLPNVKEFPLNFDFSKSIYGHYLQRCYQFSKEVFAVISKYPTALIYAQGFSVWYGIKKIGHRVILNPHGLEPFQTINNRDKIITAPFRSLLRYQFKHAAKVVSLGGRLTDILKKEMENAAKIVVLANATNAGDYPSHNFDNAKLQLLFVGRIAFNKGINILLEAVKQLNNEGYLNRLQFNIAGKGPLYEQYVKEYTFPNLNFIGFVDDNHLAQLYLENDLFVFPTLFEGMPTVVLEAMATGMPIVVTDTGATSELVDNYNGYLIEKNNVRALKCAIQKFFQLRPEQRSELSKNSYDKVIAKFTWQEVAQKHAELFHNFIVRK